MKRALVALAAVAFVVAAIIVARVNSGDEDAPTVKPSVSTASRDVVKEQAEAQSEQVMKAQAELARQVAEDKRADGQQTLVVTLREEVPGDVWVTGKIDGKPACVTSPKKDPTYIEVTAGEAGPTIKSETAPLEATLLKSGACQAAFKLFVPAATQYSVTIGGAGKGKFAAVDVRNRRHPVKVTVAG